jgi:beta-lactamase regulating signal transducer with metallopeptidase domain
MNALLEAGLANAGIALVLALLATGVSRVCKRPALVHSLWLLVLLKLLTPPVWNWRIVWPAPPPPADARAAALPVAGDKGTAAAAPRDEDATPAAAGKVDGPLAVQEKLQGAVPILPAEPVPVVESGEPERQPSDPGMPIDGPGPAIVEPANSLATAAPALIREPWKLEQLARVLGCIWLAGSLTWYLYAGIHIFRFQKLLRHARPAPPGLQEQARRLAHDLKLPRCPGVWVVPGALPPMVWAAVGRARLLFPAELLGRLTVEGRATLLAHELAHVRRRDHWVRWLELVVMGLYWWYPLVWWARLQIQNSEEECCDAWVVAQLPARAYASALLETVDFLAESDPPKPLGASGIGPVRLLKQRLVIMHRSTPSTSSAGRLAVLVAAGLLLPWRPTLADPEPPVRCEARSAKSPRNGKLWNGKLVASTIEKAPTGIAARPVNVNLPAPGPEMATFQRGEEFKENCVTLGLAYAPDGNAIAVAGDDGTVQVRSATTGQVKLVLHGHADIVTCVAFVPDGKTIATGSADRTVRLWDAGNGREVRTLSGHTNWVLAVACSPDGKTLASGGYDKSVRLWELATGKLLANLNRAHRASVRTIAFAPDGRTLASGSGDRTIKLWDLATRRQSASLRGHLGTVRAVNFAPDGKTLASGGEDHTVRLWDCATGTERAVLSGHKNEVWSLAFSPQGRTLATGSLDATVKLWDASNGRLRTTLCGHCDGISALAFAPDGRHLATGSYDKTLKLWNGAQAPQAPLLALRPGGAR